jgi:Fe-S-cluster containining protein
VVSPADLTRLCQHFQMTDEAFLRAYTLPRGGKTVLGTSPDGCCVFFSAQHGCGAHEARPDVCRAWPYFRGNLVDEISFNMARKDCPGISRTASHSDFAWTGYRYLCEHGLVAADKSCEGQALIIRKEELPAPDGRTCFGSRGSDGEDLS